MCASTVSCVYMTDGNNAGKISMRLRDMEVFTPGGSAAICGLGVPQFSEVSVVGGSGMGLRVVIDKGLLGPSNLRGYQSLPTTIEQRHC